MKRKIKQLLVGSGALAGIGAIIFGTHRHISRTTESASTPTDLSWRAWKRSILEAQKAIGDKNIAIMSAGIAYFGVLAFFPFVASMVALGGLVLEPGSVQEAAKQFREFIPQDVYSLVTTQLENASGNTGNNILIATGGIALAILSVAGATFNIMNALNVMYGIKESRSFVKKRLTSILLTVGMIISMIVVVALLVSGGELMKLLGISGIFADVLSILRWVLLAGLMMSGLAILYHFGPSRDPRVKWQWVSWGAIIATAIWVLGSAGFFIYLQHFANFSNSYSLFAGLIALMIWLNLSSFIMLLGAEINHRLEQRTEKRTTI